MKMIEMEKSNITNLVSRVTRNSPEGYTLDLKGHNKESQSTHCLKKSIRTSEKQTCAESCTHK